MSKSIGTRLALFGLLTLAMVCATSAQSPETPSVHPSRVALTADGRQLAPPQGRGGRVIDDPFEPRDASPTRNHELWVIDRPREPAIGRYQALSHNGKLVLLDTTTGECWKHEGESSHDDWYKIAPPVKQPQPPVAAATAPPVDAGSAPRD